MNINKLCAQCNQIVYPLEQLKCLDQVWHRRCFRCETCGMVLSMINYRGYDKKPYCSAHYPQPKRFTLVADTPELQRIAQNTRLFSSVNYNQRHGTGGTLDRRPATGKFRSASTIEMPSNPAGSNAQSGRLEQRSTTTSQLHYMGQSMQANGGVRYENGSSRPLYSSCSVSPGQIGVSSDNCSVDALPSVHRANAMSNEPAMSSWGHQEAIGQMSGNTAMAYTNSNLKFRAMYDYEAKEDDEVSFRDGDIILHGDPITDGWMYGTVQRTGQFGMLPSNYVEPIE